MRDFYAIFKDRDDKTVQVFTVEADDLMQALAEAALQFEPDPEQIFSVTVQTEPPRC